MLQPHLSLSSHLRSTPLDPKPRWTFKRADRQGQDSLLLQLGIYILDLWERPCSITWWQRQLVANSFYALKIQIRWLKLAPFREDALNQVEKNGEGCRRKTIPRSWMGWYWMGWRSTIARPLDHTVCWDFLGPKVGGPYGPYKQVSYHQLRISLLEI